MAAAEAPTARADGVAWPLDERGRVSTTAVAKRVWTACVDATHDAELPEGTQPPPNTEMGFDLTNTTELRKLCDRLKAAIAGERDWRHCYSTHVGQIFGIGACETSVARAQATAGLAALHTAFEFVRNGAARPLLEAALDTDSVTAPRTITVKGTGARCTEFQVPVSRVSNGSVVESVLTGERVFEQAQSWAEYGCCEPSVATAIRGLLDADSAAVPSAVDERVFCLLGGTSELGPVRTLLEHGATVAALARPGRKLGALADLARTTAGTLLLPVLDTGPVEAAAEDAEVDLATRSGMDLLLQTPEAVAWLQSVAEAYPSKKLVLGSYVYLDGEMHVRASIAMDAVVEALRQKLGSDRVELAYLGSPTTQLLWPAEALAAARQRWDNRPWYARVAGCQSNADVSANTALYGDRCVFNGAMILQGPNYNLAKALQLWRCVQARADGVKTISFNYAPPARTESVTHAPQLATALDGMQNFEPLVVLEPRTASAFMAYLLLADLVCPEAEGEFGPAHPWEPLSSRAFHGGNWRCAYTLNSTATTTYLAGQLRPKKEMVGLVPSRV